MQITKKSEPYTETHYTFRRVYLKFNSTDLSYYHFVHHLIKVYVR